MGMGSLARRRRQEIEHLKPSLRLAFDVKKTRLETYRGTKYQSRANLKISIQKMIYLAQTNGDIARARTIHGVSLP